VVEGMRCWEMRGFCQLFLVWAIVVMKGGKHRRAQAHGVDVGCCVLGLPGGKVW
jgi:hypothetical protein